MKLRTTAQKSSLRGFTLTEVTVALGVAAVIVGGIWAVASDANNNAQQEKFTELLRATVSNVRSIYSSRASFDGTASSVTTMMPFLMSMNTFPSDSIRKASNIWVVDSPFGSHPNPNAPGMPYNSFYVCGWAATGATRCSWSSGNADMPLFAVEAVVKKGRDCVGIAMRNSASTIVPGFVALYINDTFQNLPVDLQTATSECRKRDVSVVDFVYRLKP